MPVEEQPFGDTQSETGSHEGGQTETVPFYKLFTFSDSWDRFLMVVGTISAVGNGLNSPLMALLFGRMTDAFGGRTNQQNVVPLVSEVYIFASLNRVFPLSKYQL